MISAILDHLWQSTLLALGIALLALVFRTARASVRYGLWFAASLKFLVPFALLGALGRLLAPAMRPPAEVTPGAVFIEQTTQPFSQSFAAAPAAHASAPVAYGAHDASGFDPTLILLAVWALGCVTVLMVWMVRWAKIRSAVRSAIPLAWPAPMPVLASSWMREPGLVGLWRPVLVIPESLPEHLSQPEIDALIAHEACHLRRRDNLSAAVHMLVEAVFWFHPLVWWIGTRLLTEREHACDEAVVRSGHNRAAYARTLVECCRLYLQSPLSCVAGAAGSNLKRRVVMIMTSPLTSPLSRSRKTLLAAVGFCALATPVAAGWLTSPEGEMVAAHVTAVATRATSTLELASASTGSRLSLAASPAGRAEVSSDGQPAAEATAADVVEPNPGRALPLPGVEDAIRRWIEKTQLHQPDDEDMSSALADAARAQAQTTMQTLSAFGTLQGVHFVRVTPEGDDVYEADFAHAKIEVVAGPLTADGKLDQLRWGPIWARDGEPKPGVPLPPVASANQLSLTRVADVKVSRASLIPVSDRTPDAGQPLGPGHYVQTSGLKASGDCNDRMEHWYTLSTLPIAPGHVITNFHYELRGDNRCDSGWPARQRSSECEMGADRPDKKAVRFQLLTNGDYCFSNTAFAEDGSHHDNEASTTISQPGAVTHGEMVISYDVQ